MVCACSGVLKEKLLVDPEQKEKNAKRVLSSDTPSIFKSAFSELGHKILTSLANKPMYPAELARELNVYHQTVYYHIKRLELSGLIERSESKIVRGGRANFFSLSFQGYAVEFNIEGETLKPTFQAPRQLGTFFKEFVDGGTFNGWIVVGSPVPHGPNMTQGRDGHYAIQLGFTLGQFVGIPSNFPVKLDVDVKAEKLERSNLIIVGGPRTNIIASELNEHLPIRFKEGGFWGSIIDDKGSLYSSELDCLIAKVRNPWDRDRVCIIAAGLSGAGTKAAIIGLSNYSGLILQGYSGGEFACVLRGIDLNSDGKVDSVEILRRVT